AGSNPAGGTQCSCRPETVLEADPRESVRLTCDYPGCVSTHKQTWLFAALHLCRGHASRHAVDRPTGSIPVSRTKCLCSSEAIFGLPPNRCGGYVEIELH